MPVCSYIFPNPAYVCVAEDGHGGPHRSSRPAFDYESCRERNYHGGCNYLFAKPDGTKEDWCLHCYKIVTPEESADRIKRNGGPGHWLGCKLDPNHDGDCLVGKWR